MSDILKYSQYSISVGNVPKQYDVPKHIQDLLNNPIKKYEFHKENEIITKFDAITAELIVQKHEKAILDKITNEQLHHNDVIVVPIDHTINESNNNNNLGGTSFLSNTNTNSNQDYLNDLTSFNHIIPEQSQQHITVKQQDKPTHESIINDMMKQTYQEKDVCYFYLESANWDLNNAIELLKSMDAR